MESGPLQELPPDAGEDAHGLGPVVQLLQEIRKEEPPLAAQIAIVSARIHKSDEAGWEDPEQKFAWDPALEALLKAEGDQLRNSPRVAIFVSENSFAGYSGVRCHVRSK